MRGPHSPVNGLGRVAGPTNAVFTSLAIHGTLTGTRCILAAISSATVSLISSTSLGMNTGNVLCVAGVVTPAVDATMCSGPLAMRVDFPSAGFACQWVVREQGSAAVLHCDCAREVHAEWIMR